MLVRKVERRWSSSGDDVGVNVGTAPGISRASFSASDI